MVESFSDEAGADVVEEIVTPSARRHGKRKALLAEIPCVEMTHELSCECGCRKHVSGEEVGEQLEIVPMQARMICTFRKVYACKDWESVPATAGKPAQLIEKSIASPCVQAMLLTSKCIDGLPLQRFEIGALLGMASR